MPGAESEREVLDFAALAHSIRPAALPVEPPGEVARKIVAHESKSDARTGVSWIWIAAGFGGILLGALGAIVIESQLQSETKAKAVAVAKPVVSDVAPPTKSAVEEVRPSKPAAPAPAFVAVQETESEPTAPKVSKQATQKPSTVVSADAQQTRRSRMEPAPKPVAEAPKKAAVVEDVSKKLAEAAIEEEAAEPEQPAVDLPEQPSREDVARLLRGAHAEIEACAAGRHGVATITLRIGSSGRVKSAIVDGAFQGSSEGSCMARAARKIRFPKFTEDSFQVEYPYRL